MCEVSEEMERARRGFMEMIGGRRTELDHWYKNLFMETTLVLDTHYNHCVDCRRGPIEVPARKAAGE